MKAYTNIEQSKKLAEILPIESADMYYPYDLDENKLLSIPIVKDDYSMPCINCWSLAALIDVSPREMRLLKSSTDDTYHCDCPQVNIDKWYDNPIDAYVEMLESLQKKMVYDFNNYRENE